MTETQRRLLLSRVTGSDRIPFSGFGDLVEAVKISNSGSSERISVDLNESRIALPEFDSDVDLVAAIYSWLDIDIQLININEDSTPDCATAFDNDAMDMEPSAINWLRNIFVPEEWLRNIFSHMSRGTRRSLLASITGYEFVMFDSVDVLLRHVAFHSSHDDKDFVIDFEAGLLLIPQFGSDVEFNTAFERWSGFPISFD